MCNKCNHKRLQDRALVEWPPISVFRTLGQIRKRRGGLVDAGKKTRWHLEHDERDPHLFRLEARADTSHESGRDNVARALCKIALETRWLEDAVDARSSRWDAVAAAAIGDPLPPGLVMGLTQPATIADVDLRPDSEVVVFDDAEALRMECQVRVVGLRLFLMIGSTPPSVPNTAWWVLDPRTSSLDGPDSMWARFWGRAKTATPLTSPPADEPSGSSSRLPIDHEHVHLYLQPPQSGWE
jgi:hypothetical protein